jgi:DNA-directed RNA polymerase specialized sigma24 family protein
LRATLINQFYVMLDQQMFEKLCSYDWEKIVLDLTLYASDRLLALKAAKVKLPLAQEPADYAKEAVRLLFDEKRMWHPDKDPDLVKFLKYSVVKSLIYNERTSPAVKKRAEAKVQSKGNEYNDEELNFSDVISSRDPTADSLLIEQQTLEKIRFAVRDDDEASLVLEELIKSNKPREIANDLGITIDEVRNILKRIRRKATEAIN